MKSTNWSELGYSVFITGDESPSLKPTQSEDSEMMHHRGGALAESRLIYGRVINKCFKTLECPVFYSLGLGLGYNEALVAEAAVHHRKDFKLVSDELDPNLVRTYLGFLKNELSPSSEIFKTYESYFKMLKTPPSDVSKALIKAYDEKRWIIRGPLTNETSFPFHINGFFWDAFSQKTSPTLWEEDFLNKFFKQNSDPQFAVLATYASVGKMKRALKQNNYNVQVCEGFHGKRNSTYAERTTEPIIDKK